MGQVTVNTPCPLSMSCHPFFIHSGRPPRISRSHDNCGGGTMRRRIHVAASFGNTSCSMPGVCSIPPRTCERPRCYACHAVTGVTLLHAYWEALLYFSQSKVKRLALLHKASHPQGRAAGVYVGGYKAPDAHSLGRVAPILLLLPPPSLALQLRETIRLNRTPRNIQEVAVVNWRAVDPQIGVL